MDVRQLRYFVTLTEELHFGRAAAREHIVQSALSQQIQRLERELGVILLERSTHHVRLTAAGGALLPEARQILAQLDRAATAARSAAVAAPVLRVATVDTGHTSVPVILDSFRRAAPDVAVHLIEAGVPEQLRMLADGRLDVGWGRAAAVTAGVAAELVRLEPLGVLIREDHVLAGLPAVPIARLAGDPLLMLDEARAAEYNQFVVELCRSVGVVPRPYRGSVQTVHSAIDFVRRDHCIFCAPESGASTTAGVAWRPLTEPAARYPWSVLWRDGERSPQVHTFVACARSLSRDRDWLAVRGRQAV